METAARAEAFMEQYEGLPVRWLVIDIWDGNADQCAIFENNAGLSQAHAHERGPQHRHGP
jgi:hypothetical protein